MQGPGSGQFQNFSTDNWTAVQESVSFQSTSVSFNNACLLCWFLYCILAFANIPVPITTLSFINLVLKFCGFEKLIFYFDFFLLFPPTVTDPEWPVPSAWDTKSGSHCTCHCWIMQRKPAQHNQKFQSVTFHFYHSSKSFIFPFDSMGQIIWFASSEMVAQFKTQKLDHFLVPCPKACNNKRPTKTSCSLSCT